MSTDTPGGADAPDPTGRTGPDGTDDMDTTEPTPGSDGDGAEAGYTPPSGSDDPVPD